MIHESNGDLLAAEVDALVNTVNCVGVMGKGLALQFKRTYPANFTAYEAACKRNEVVLGKMYVVPTNAISGPKWIINFPTKGHWKAKSKLSDIREGLDDLVRVIADLGIKSIAVPPLGAGNGGLDWPDVAPLIRAALDDLPGLDVMLFEPSRSHRSVVASQIKMTWGRAVLVSLVDEYVAQRQAIEPWDDPSGASALEIQKLMYFANQVEPRLKLSYAAGRYGPYSDQVRHLIQGMEGTFLRGFGDGSQPVLDLEPISPTEEGRTSFKEFVVGFPNLDREVIQPVLRLTNGFEGPYGLELLASVHWVATRENAQDAASATAAVGAWTARKGRLFTPDHVDRALQHLHEAGAIPG